MFFFLDDSYNTLSVQLATQIHRPRNRLIRICPRPNEETTSQFRFFCRVHRQDLDTRSSALHQLSGLTGEQGQEGSRRERVQFQGVLFCSRVIIEEEPIQVRSRNGREDFGFPDFCPFVQRSSFRHPDEERVGPDLEHRRQDGSGRSVLDREHCLIQVEMQTGQVAGHVVQSELESLWERLCRLHTLVDEFVVLGKQKSRAWKRCHSSGRVRPANDVPDICGFDESCDPFRQEIHQLFRIRQRDRVAAGVGHARQMDSEDEGQDDEEESGVLPETEEWEWIAPRERGYKNIIWKWDGWSGIGKGTVKEEKIERWAPELLESPSTVREEVGEDLWSQSRFSFHRQFLSKKEFGSGGQTFHDDGGPRVLSETVDVNGMINFVEGSNNQVRFGSRGHRSFECPCSFLVLLFSDIEDYKRLSRDSGIDPLAVSVKPFDESVSFVIVVPFCVTLIRPFVLVEEVDIEFADPSRVVLRQRVDPFRPHHGLDPPWKSFQVQTSELGGDFSVRPLRCRSKKVDSKIGSAGP